MPISAWILGGFALAFAAFVVIEGRRQRKRHPDARGRGGRIAGAGMIELQQLLQPDRKVEIVQLQQKREEVREAERDDQGDPP